MPKHATLHTRRVPRPLLAVGRWCRWYWQKNWFHKIVTILLLIIALSVGSMYGIARWYIWQQHDKPLILGASFIPDYAEQLGVDPQATLHAMLTDLGIKHLRLTSYWSDIEPTKGHYDFSTLDWEFAQADAAHAQVSLSIGLRQPR